MCKKFECQPNLARPCPGLLCVCWSSLEPEMQKPLFWNELDCNFGHAAIPSLLWLPWHPSPLHFFTWHTCRYMVMVWCGFVSRIALDICPLYSPIHGPLDEIQWGSGWLWYTAEIALASLLRVKLAQPRISTSRCSIFAAPPPTPPVFHCFDNRPNMYGAKAERFHQNKHSRILLTGGEADADAKTFWPGLNCTILFGSTAARLLLQRRRRRRRRRRRKIERAVIIIVIRRAWPLTMMRMKLMCGGLKRKIMNWFFTKLAPSEQCSEAICSPSRVALILKPWEIFSSHFYSEKSFFLSLTLRKLVF